MKQRYTRSNPFLGEVDETGGLVEEGGNESKFYRNPNFSIELKTDTVNNEKQTLPSFNNTYNTLPYPGPRSGCADSTKIYKFRYNGKRYEIVKEMKNWDAAAACAVERGGYLAQINSQAEQDSIYFAITSSAAIPTNYTVVADGGGIAYVWIGAKDKHAEGTWLWDGNNDNVGANFWNGQGTAGAGGGSAVSGAYSHWGGTTTGTAKEPDNYAGSQNAAGIALASWPLGSSSPLGIGGEWNDINLTNQLYYVIEYDNATETENLSKTDSEIDVVLYPNPAHNMLRITVGQTNPIDKVSVYDPSGKVMLTGNTSPLNIEALSTGFYIVAIELKNGDRIYKSLIVN